MKVTLAILSLSLLTVGAFALDVRYNFASDVNFSKYKTYKWVEIPGDQLEGLTDGQLKNAFDAQLAMKGLTRTGNDNADLYVGYQVALNQEKEMRLFRADWDYGSGWGRGWYGLGAGASPTSTIEIGQVTVDMYDSADKKLVWRGVVSKPLDPKSSPEKRLKNLVKAAQKLFKNYPPQKKS